MKVVEKLYDIAQESASGNYLQVQRKDTRESPEEMVHTMCIFDERYDQVFF